MQATENQNNVNKEEEEDYLDIDEENEFNKTVGDQTAKTETVKGYVSI